VLLRSYFLMEEIVGATDLGAYFCSGRSPDARLIEQAATLVARLHEEGYSHDEIAQMTGIAPGTARAQLWRARRALMGMLDA